MRGRTGGPADRRTVRAVAAWLLLSVSPTVRLSAQGFPVTPPKPTPLTPVRFPPFKEATLADGEASLSDAEAGEYARGGENCRMGE